jgi:pimeloyl-ACP methyl ester carboxylesterase
MTMQHSHKTVREQLLEGLPLNQRHRELAGITTSVLEGGDGPPLVLLHGGIQAGGIIWWRVLPRLVSTHRVVVPDLPGLGESAPAARLDARTVTGWLDGLIETTCEEPPILVAHSTPGALAARFAVQRGARLRRLVLVDAAGLAPFRPSPGLLVALLRSVLRPTIGSFEGLMGRVMHDLDRVRQQEGERWQALASYTVSRATRPSAKQAIGRWPAAAPRRSLATSSAGSRCPPRCCGAATTGCCPYRSPRRPAPPSAGRCTWSTTPVTSPTSSSPTRS